MLLSDAGLVLRRDASASLSFSLSFLLLCWIVRPPARRNRVGDEGAKHLALALQSVLSLTELDLSDNRIGANGQKRLKSAMVRRGRRKHWRRASLVFFAGFE